MCVGGGNFSLYALGMILSVRRRFAVAAGEVVSDCKSLLSSQFFGCLPIALRCGKYLHRQVRGSCRVVAVVVVVGVVVVVVVVEVESRKT